MTAERLYLQLLFQEAAEIELDGLTATRARIAELIEKNSGGADIEYPRMLALNAEIEQAQRAHAQRRQKIEKLRTTPDEPLSRRAPSRLELLVQRQDEARTERAELLEAREDIQRAADRAGQADLDDEQDRRFRELTAEIADVDEEIRVRDEEIETLAALNAVPV